MENTTEQESIVEGEISKVVFSDDNSGYRVLQVRTADGIATVAGKGPSVRYGASVRAVGTWTQSRYGRQLTARSVAEIDAITDFGLANSINGLVEGLGEKRSLMLVKALGGAKEAIKAFDSGNAYSFKFLPEGIYSALINEWSNSRIKREIDAQLSSFGLTEGIKAKIYLKYQTESVKVLKENPYRIINEIEGVAFLTADDVAIKIGVDINSNERIDAAIIYAISIFAEESGNTICELNDITKSLCNIFMKRPTPEYFGKDPFKATKESIQRLVDKEWVISPFENFYCIRDLFYAENEIYNSLVKIIKNSNELPPIGNIQESILAVKESLGLDLSEDQIKAVEDVSNFGALVITGGPGVGKTSTCKAIVHLAESNNLKVLLCTPTARAAKRLSESTNRQAYTIHKLLEVQYNGQFARNKYNRLNADLVLCDEQSMTDSFLMSSLLQALPDRCRLVLVGDVNQLPPVGPGSAFRDIINSGKIPVCRLTKIHRQSEGSQIVKSSHGILNGISPTKFKSEDGSREDGCLHIVESTSDNAAGLISSIIEDIEENLDSDPWDSLVISPMRKGSAGVVKINEILQEKLNPASVDKREYIYGKGETERKFRLGDKVRQTKNDYNRGVVNGDIGRICQVFEKNSKTEINALEVDFSVIGSTETESRKVFYKHQDLANLTLSYCGTIHSAQGSESKTVILCLVDSHYIMLSRTLLYTAITRAKRACIIVGSKKAISIAVKNTKDDSRKTLLSYLFKND